MVDLMVYNSSSDFYKLDFPWTISEKDFPQTKMQLSYIDFNKPKWSFSDVKMLKRFKRAKDKPRKRTSR